MLGPRGPSAALIAYRRGMARIDAASRRLLRARDAMDRSYAKPLDVPALARIALTSEAHFIRTFKQTFGETPHRYLQRRRLERAMALLRETDRAVTEICLEVGFTSLGTFSRTFSRVLGMSPTDADLGFMRWLTVNVPGRPESELVLAAPEMGNDEATAAEIRALVAKGGGSGVIFSVDDCRRTYEELLAKGVEFTQEPTRHFYGIDCGLRDPFGNPLRFTQPAPGPIEVPSPGELANAE